jgi:hypothetical protein
MNVFRYIAEAAGRLIGRSARERPEGVAAPAPGELSRCSGVAEPERFSAPAIQQSSHRFGGAWPPPPEAPLEPGVGTAPNESGEGGIRTRAALDLPTLRYGTCLWFWKGVLPDGKPFDRLTLMPIRNKVAADELMTRYLQGQGYELAEPGEGTKSLPDIRELLDFGAVTLDGIILPRIGVTGEAILRHMDIVGFIRIARHLRQHRRPPYVAFERALDRNARNSLRVVEDYRREATALLTREIIDIQAYPDIHDKPAERDTPSHH